jgi:hypothetical protein
MVDVRIVNHGVDTLAVNVWHTDEMGNKIKRLLDDELAAQLEQWKRAAQEEGEHVTPWKFNGAHLLMQPNGVGRGQYPWMLKTRDITFYVSSGKWNGIGAVRLSSPFLWSCRSLLEAIVQVQVLVDELFKDEMHLQVSNVDLCADAVWQDAKWLTKDHFVTRARYRRDHAAPGYGLLTPDRGMDENIDNYGYGLHQTGLSFGIGPKRRGPVSAVMYDKSREITNSDKEWFEDLWRSNGWSEEDGSVWRVEVRYRREALHELKQEVAGEEIFHGIEDAYVLPDLLALLWSYGVGNKGGGPDGLPDGWLRCVIPGTDRNRSRLPTHPVWEVIQEAFLVPGEQPANFGKVVRKRWRDRNIDKAVEAIMGYLTSLGALLRHGGEMDEIADLSMMLHWLAQVGPEYFKRVERDFAEEVQRKLLLLAVGQ